MKLLKNGLITVFLVMLSACSSTQEPQTVTEIIVQTQYKYVTPPSEYLSPCEVNQTVIADNADLLGYAQLLEALVDQCNENINRIKQWASENNG